MKVKLEHLNMATGFCLCLAGVLYALQQDFPAALSWGIFGAMYLVMDSYKPCPAGERDMSRLIREVFGFVGFCLALLLLVYIGFTFSF